MEGDTIRVNDNYETVALGEATMYGLVKKVDFVSNITTVQYYICAKSENKEGEPGNRAILLSVQKLVAAGEGQGLWKGKQLYFDAEGKVEAKDGKIENVEVVSSGGDPSLDNETIRIIKSMPRWKPCKKRDKLIRVKYTMPVNFKLK